jgi:GTPase SAR1 family protein
MYILFSVALLLVPIFSIFCRPSATHISWIWWTDVLFFHEKSRMTLLLGPPGSGKTTLLLALAGKLGSDLKVKISTCYINMPDLSIHVTKFQGSLLLLWYEPTRFQEKWHTMGMEWMSLWLRGQRPTYHNMTSTSLRWRYGKPCPSQPDAKGLEADTVSSNLITLWETVTSL